MNYPATDTPLLRQLSPQTLCDLLKRINLTHVSSRDGRKRIPFYDRKGSREVRDGNGALSPTHGAPAPSSRGGGGGGGGGDGGGDGD